MRIEKAQVGSILQARTAIRRAMSAKSRIGCVHYTAAKLGKTNRGEETAIDRETTRPELEREDIKHIHSNTIRATEMQLGVAL